MRSPPPARQTVWCSSRPSGAIAGCRSGTIARRRARSGDPAKSPVKGFKTGSTRPPSRPESPRGEAPTTLGRFTVLVFLADRSRGDFCAPVRLHPSPPEASAGPRGRTDGDGSVGEESSEARHPTFAHADEHDATPELGDGCAASPDSEAGRSLLHHRSLGQRLRDAERGPRGGLESDRGGSDVLTTTTPVA